MCRLHRAVLQPDASALDTWVHQSDRVRGSSGSLGWCRRNRQQPCRVFFDGGSLTSGQNIFNSCPQLEPGFSLLFRVLVMQVMAAHLGALQYMVLATIDGV